MRNERIASRGALGFRKVAGRVIGEGSVPNANYSKSTRASALRSSAAVVGFLPRQHMLSETSPLHHRIDRPRPRAEKMRMSEEKKNK